MPSPAPIADLDRPAARRAARFWAALHLRRGLGRRATWLAVGGVALTVIALLLGGGLGRDAIGVLVLAYLAPLLALYFGTGVIREEIEDQTLTYAFTRPVPRAWLYLARYLAAAALVGLAIVPGALIAFGLAPARWLAALLAVLVYTAIFAALGMLARGATWVGLAFLAWEHALILVPGFLSRLSLLAYVHGLAALPIDAGVLSPFVDRPGRPLSLAVLALALALALALGALAIERREIVIER